ncbi:MAG: phenylalanine--tRNA ligase subunit alpha, partial [Epsilonproteobacteria bacterium]|nr:phenylalanine--tRNA ligase subunit alpha [Campylobacterota bacterium]
MKKYIQKIKSATDLNELEKLRVEIFGKKGILASSFAKLKTLADAEKKEFAKELNLYKTKLNELLQEKKEALAEKETKELMKKDGVDVTLFDAACENGALHPVQATMDKMIEYFFGLNFEIQEGPLVEDDFH